MELIKGGAPQYKANLHSHSTLSDGHLSPEALKEAYKSHGYSVLAITDHEYPCDHSELSDPSFVMLTGYEAYIRSNSECRYDRYGEEIHINLLARDAHNTSYVNYTDMYCKYVKDEAVRRAFKKVGSSEPREYTVEYINSFVREAKAAGYLCAYNHPAWSLERHEQIARYDGFFSMEMCNWGSHITNALEYNAVIYDRLLREGKRIFCHSADDNHNAVPFDSPRSDSFGAFTMILAEELSYGGIIAALEAGNFYSSMGPRFLSIEAEGSHVTVKTDPVSKIIMHFGSKATKYEASFEDDITVAEFDIPSEAPYVRFTALDAHGRAADTRGYFRDELGLSK